MSKQQQHHQSSSSSQIHILPPLPLRYHNLPAPVIHPPGSDPFSFTNPNPTASSMDADPCVVASRDEIVAKEFDLTASEHAGVTLSEATTIMSTTSNTLVTTTKTETKNISTSFINHNVCNVTCNGEITLNKHMEEKIDLKNTQKPTFNQETSSPVANDNLDKYPEKKKKNQDLDITQMLQDSTAITQSSVANDSLYKDSKKKKQNLIQNTSDLKSLLVCDIPEPGHKYPKIVTIEMDESVFKNGFNGVQPFNIDTQNKHVDGEQHKNNILISSENKVWCEICKIKCSSNDYERHILGKKHIKNCKKSEKIPSLPSTVIDSVTSRPVENVKLTKGEVVNPNEGNNNSTRCELCGVCCTSVDVFNQHIKGKKHQKNLKKSEKLWVESTVHVVKTPSPEPMIEEGEIVFLERNKRKGKELLTTSVEDANDTKRQKINKEEGCDVLVICKVCNVVCDGLMAFKTHSCNFGTKMGHMG